MNIVYVDGTPMKILEMKQICSVCCKVAQDSLQRMSYAVHCKCKCAEQPEHQTQLGVIEHLSFCILVEPPMTCDPSFLELPFQAHQFRTFG